MFRVIDCIVQDHDIWLVLVAGLICVLASQTAFSLMRKANLTSRRGAIRLIAAAVSMGSGVWATHFIAMLAYRTPWNVGFDLPVTAASALIAVGISILGLALVLSGLTLRGGAIVGGGIGAMHFTGMYALEGAFQIAWDKTFVIVALVLGISLTMLAFHLRPVAQRPLQRGIVVGLYALAVCALHFTAMAAATLSFDVPIAFSGSDGLQRQTLGIAVASVAALLLGSGLLSAMVDDILAGRNAREATRLRRHIAKLEATQAELRETTENLSLALEAAAASSQAKSQFLATMSHELRTPLNAIIGFAELIRSELHGPIGDPTYGEYIDDIHQSGTHLLALINDVLDYSKIDAGRLELSESPADVRRIVSDCLRLMAPQAREANLTVHEYLPKDPLYMLVDHRRIRQIVLNLLSNAVKFTPPDGSLTVTLSVGDDGVGLTVVDTGIGMKPEQIPLAMEAFGQIDNSLSRSYEGTGLGLPLCRRLAELHGGSFSIESEQGAGTTVTVLLPHERLTLSTAA